MMSKRQFDHIENKIREAAENSEPLFNEHAWEKMELLLDKEDKKRRFFFWWRFGLSVMLLLSGVAGYLFFSGNPVEKKIATTLTQAQTTEKITDVTTTASDTLSAFNGQPETRTASLPDAPPVIKSDKIQKEPDVIIKDLSGSKSALSGKEKTANNFTKEKRTGNDVDPENLQLPVSSRESFNKKKKLLSRRIQKAKVNVVAGEVVLSEDQHKIRDVAIYGSADVKDTSNSDAKTDSLFVVSLKKQNTSNDSIAKAGLSKDKVTEKNKTVKPVSSMFYFVVEGGGEVLSTKLFSYNNSVISGRFGAAAGFEINKRLSVQAGFYAGRKKYTGAGSDYHPKQGSYMSMVNLKKVDASCLIYDIPISARYNFSGNSKMKWYTMVGISSFIMKKEDYNYYYTYNSMPNMIHEKAYSYIGNKNLFSVLTLSAGVEKQIFNRTSLIVEPYLSVPLHGVGEGTVKLYSAGLQAGLKYKPKF